MGPTRYLSILIFKVFCVIFSLFSVSQVYAYEFQTLDFPEGVGTQAHGINDIGTIVGWVRSSYAQPQAEGPRFVYDGNKYISIEHPNSFKWTTVNDINNDGMMIGSYTDSSGRGHGFTFNGVEFTTFDYMANSTVSTFLSGINNNGTIVGYGYDGDFTYDGNEYTLFQYPSSTMTVPKDINDSGIVVGEYQDDTGRHGFIFDGNNYTTIDYLGASCTTLNSNNNSGVCLGYYIGPADQKGHGFFFNGSEIIEFDVPGSGVYLTRPVSINNNGVIVGMFLDSIGNGEHGFLDTPDSETTAVFKDASGDPSNLPEKLVIGQTYQITAKYTAEGGISGLDECYLQITHPSFPLVMAYVVGTGDIYRDFNVEEYLSPISVTREDLPDQSGVILTWNFFIKPHWPLTDDGIDFAVYVTDNNQNADGWNFAGDSLAYSPPEFGATIITHGFQAGSVSEWTRTMGRSIGKRLGNASVYQLDPNSGQFELVSDGSYMSFGDGSEFEKIFIMDWANESNDVFTRGFSEAAADAFLAALIRHQINNPIPYFLDRLHFIGHSRGCVVNSEIVERIVNFKNSKSAIKQYPNFGREINVTYLDPHPIFGIEGTADKVNPGDTEQDQVQVWNSVNYCDNYYQPDNAPDGMPIINAYNRNLDDISGLNLSHSEVHAWYFGTIDPEATNDELANMVMDMQESIPAMNLRDDNVPQDIDINLADRALWYQDARGLIEGFAHSPHGGNNVGETRVPPSSSTTPFYNYLNDDFFNGSFIYGNNQIPGWEYQGGGGDGFVDFEHLELEVGNESRTHNWLYIPSNAKTISFSYKTVNNSAGSPPSTDQLQLQISDGLSSHLISQADPIWLNQETDAYVSKSYDISEFAGTVAKIKFEILKGGLLLDSKVYIDDVQLQFNMPMHMPWIPLLLLND